jgi:uncharacterized membrane protein YhfC
MLTKEYIVMSLITMDLAFVSLYVGIIWFVQRKIRNLLFIFITAKEKYAK